VQRWRGPAARVTVVGAMSAFEQSAAPEGFSTESRTAAPVLRSIGHCALWSIVSAGLWPIAWVRDTLRDIGDELGEDTSPVLWAILSIFPLVNLVATFFIWRHIDAFLRQSGRDGLNLGVYFGLFVVLYLFFGLGVVVLFVLVQNRLNDAWIARKDGAAVAAPLSGLGKVLIAIGVLAWIAGIALVVVGISSS
jgi:hypothetical protein